MNENVQISLGAEIVYVYGLINGVEAEFSKISASTWQATALKSPDNKYVIEVTAYDSVGQFTTYKTTIYKLGDMISPIIDRTAESSYGYEDVNRVNANIQYLVETLNSVGFSITISYDAPVDKTRTDWPYVSLISAMKQNINDVISGFFPVQAPPLEVSSERVQYFDYNQANDIEKNILAIYELYRAILIGFKRCGAFNCGESEALI